MLGRVLETRYRITLNDLGYSLYVNSNALVMTSACSDGAPRGRKEMLLSSQPMVNYTRNDLEFEWLLCLAHTVQAFRRLPVSEFLAATRPALDETGRDPNFDHLLFLTSELQASRHLQTHRFEKALRSPRIEPDVDRKIDSPPPRSRPRRELTVGGQ